MTVALYYSFTSVAPSCKGNSHVAPVTWCFTDPGLQADLQIVALADLSGSDTRGTSSWTDRQDRRGRQGAEAIPSCNVAHVSLAQVLVQSFCCIT